MRRRQYCDITIREGTNTWALRRCIKCHKYLRLDEEFYVTSTSICKNCERKERMEAYRKKHPEVKKKWYAKFELRTCYLCKQDLLPNQFYADCSRATKTNPKGLSARCKKCDNQRREDRRETRKQSYRTRP